VQNGDKEICKIFKTFMAFLLRFFYGFENVQKNPRAMSPVAGEKRLGIGE